MSVVFSWMIVQKIYNSYIYSGTITKWYITILFIDDGCCIAIHWITGYSSDLHPYLPKPYL